MNEASGWRRRRTVEALGLGPLWTLRERMRVFDEASAPASVDGLATRAASIATMDLAALHTAVTTCRACALCASRTQAVPGAGALRPHWMVVGDAPAADDDATGEALAGQPGRLLDAMLNAVGLSRRESVFVTTSVKCRPPADRSPTAAEIACCRPFLDRQIELLGPRLIVILGSSIDDRQHMGTPAIAMRHPAELIERPEAKAEAWEDLCRARERA
jgi:DNA polymerase